jgi:ATP-dependent helicase HrpB
LQQSIRLQRLLGVQGKIGSDSDLGSLLALSYPERIAKRKDGRSGRYITVQGTTVTLPESSLLNREEFLAVGDVDGIGAEVRVFLAQPISKDEIVRTFSNSLSSEMSTFWDAQNECVRSIKMIRLGAVTIAEQQFQAEKPETARALIDGIRLNGPGILPWSREAESLRSRSEWLRTSALVGEDWPQLDDHSLMESLEDWLPPFVAGMWKRSQLDALPLRDALLSRFTFEQKRTLDRLAPAAIVVPSGSTIPLEYTAGSPPVLSVKLQELFGLRETPRISNGRVGILVHLLSPARRPLAVTQDLQSFWTGTYPEIRKQLRAQYPKHPWPEDPFTAMPTRQTLRRSRQ